MLGSNGRARLRMAAAAAGMTFASFAGGEIAVAASGPPVAVPDGSTLVPSQADFEKGLGVAPSVGDTLPATASALCAPNVGAPTRSPSSVDVAIGPTTGVIVSNAGYLTFSKSNPADCANHTLTSLDLFFASAVTHSTGVFSNPRVVYDPHIDRFVMIALSPDSSFPARQYLYHAVSTDNTGTSWTKVEDGEFLDEINSFTLGFAQGYSLIVESSTAGNTATVTYIYDTSPSSTGSFGSSDFVNAVAPRVLDNSTTAIFLGVGSGGSAIKRVSYTVGTSTDSVDAITVPSFSAPPKVTQSNGQTLDSGTGNFVGSSVQIGSSVWNVQPVGVDGHARFRLYKFSTTATTPVMTFTPTILGTEDLFNATMATGSETAGSRAFVSASEVEPGTAGPSFLGFIGPNNSTQAWSYDAVAHAASEYTSCGSDGCSWTLMSGAAIDPSDSSKAWVANQLTSGTAATNWTVAAAALSGAGASHPPGPIASSATGVGTSGFTANWSALSQAVGYQLDVATDSAFTASASAGSHPAGYVSGYQAKDVGNVTSFAVTGLSGGTTYYYRVRGVGDFTSDSSNTISVKTDTETTAIGPLELLAMSLLAFAGLGLRYRRD